MKTKAISEICLVNPRIPASLSSQKSRDVDFIPMANVSEDGRIIINAPRKLHEVQKGYTYFQNGDVIVAKITPCMENGKAAYIRNLPHEVGFGSTEFHVLRPQVGLDPAYLFHMVWNPFFRREARRNMTGTAGQQRVPASFFERFKIPLPPLPEQRRIADILDKADAIRRKRQEAVELSSDFLPSLFANMFGPFGNKYRTEPLNNHLTFITSGSRGWAEHYVTVGKRFIRSLDVQMNRIGTDDVVFVNPPKGAEADRTRVQNGDVLVTITGSRIGRVAYVPYKFGEAYVSQHVSIIRPASSLRPRYCSMFLSLADGGQRQIAKAQYGQTKPGLSLSNIREFQIPIPPIAEQDRFIDIWTSHEELAARLGQGSHESDGFFNSLVQRAFRGEL